MAAGPVYGKQFIRFAETGLVPENLALEQFTMVTINNGVASEPPTLALAAGAGEIFGVLQQEFNNATTSDSATDAARLATVATSGLLLIKAANGAVPAQNAVLSCDAAGYATSANAPVTVGGTSPIVRQQVLIGGVEMVLVSFN